MNPTVLEGGFRFPAQKLTDEVLKQRAPQRTVVVIGGTKGIGRGIAEAFGSFGATSVTVLGRTFDAKPGSNVKFVQADLTLMSTCKALAEANAKLLSEADEIVFTNGIFCAGTREETAENLEKDMAVSYLSRLVFMDKILEQTKAKANKPNVRVWVFGFPGMLKATDTNLLEDLNAEKGYEQMPQHMKTVFGEKLRVPH
jgi:NAD(P)-dependent dehydrogenase (short-subunit alcohol dehydrogenase family)